MMPVWLFSSGLLGPPPCTWDASTDPDEQLVRMSMDAPPHSLVV